MVLLSSLLVENANIVFVIVRIMESLIVPVTDIFLNLTVILVGILLGIVIIMGMIYIC